MVKTLLVKKTLSFPTKNFPIYTCFFFAFEGFLKPQRQRYNWAHYNAACCNATVQTPPCPAWKQHAPSVTNDVGTGTISTLPQIPISLLFPPLCLCGLQVSLLEMCTGEDRGGDGKSLPSAQTSHRTVFATIIFQPTADGEECECVFVEGWGGEALQHPCGPILKFSDIS